MSDKYSVWLVPASDTSAYQQLEQTIKRYAQRYEDAPRFEPHVTVLGGIEGDQSVLKESVRDLTEDQVSFDIDFTKVQCSTTRHQCVFLLVEPSIELLSLHQTLSVSFGMGGEMYVPHLSLIYSDMNIEKRLEMVDLIELSSLPRTAHIDTVALVKTTGGAQEWKSIETYDLQ